MVNESWKSKEQHEKKPDVVETAQNLFSLLSTGVAAIEYLKKNKNAIDNGLEASTMQALRHPDKSKEIFIGAGLEIVNNFLDIRRKHGEERSRINNRVIMEFQRLKNQTKQREAEKQKEQGTDQEAKEVSSDLDATFKNIANAFFPGMKPK